jgi:ribosome-binding protein aMBF1 (putative translation factor)
MTYNGAVAAIELRRAKGWSQEELAKESGLHRTYVSSSAAFAIPAFSFWYGSPRR